MEEAKRKRLRLGVVVFAVLVVLEVIEFVLGTTLTRGALAPLAILVMAAAWPIVRYYMHVEQLRGGGGG